MQINNLYHIFKLSNFNLLMKNFVKLVIIILRYLYAIEEKDLCKYLALLNLHPFFIKYRLYLFIQIIPKGFRRFLSYLIISKSFSKGNSFY